MSKAKRRRKRKMQQRQQRRRWSRAEWRRLYNAARDKGVRLISILVVALLFSGCSQTTATHKKGTTTVSRWRFLMTEDIGSASFDATDGSFTIDGYKSDMTHALDLIDKLAKKEEVEP